MRTRVKLKPGQNGTKKLTAHYGERLVCVRYRYDIERRKRFKTVEIIVEESDWTPSPTKYSAGSMVPLRIGPRETAVREQVRTLGGRWDPEQLLWFIPYGCIRGTKLEKFIVLKTKDIETK
jgi:hypothetical protein